METSFPWDGLVDGDAATLAAYDEQEWDDNERMLFGSGGNVGVLTQPYNLNLLAVTERGAGANMSVDVDSGAALVYGKRYKSTATVNLTIAANASGNPRIDRVVVVWNRQAVAYAGVTPNIDPKTCRGAVLQGTPAAVPAAPALTQNSATVYMIPLAQVAVANGAVSITNSNITDEREFAVPVRELHFPIWMGSDSTTATGAAWERAGSTMGVISGGGNVLFDPDDYPGGEVFFEVVVGSSLPETISARLYDLTGVAAVAGSTLTYAGAGERLRTASALTLTSGAREYLVEIQSSTGAGANEIQAARLIVRWS